MSLEPAIARTPDDHEVLHIAATDTDKMAIIADPSAERQRIC